MSKNEDPSQWGESTLAIHGPGRLPKAHHSVSTPIIQTSNYYFDTSAELIEYMDAKLQGRQLREAEYGRYGNPTQTETQRKLAALEGAERALIFSSGMAAVILPLLTFAKPDGHVVFTDDCYRQTREFADRMLKKFNVPYSLAKPDIASIEAAIRPNTNILFSETPTNPYMRCIDLPKLVALAKRRRCMTMIDSTLATPYNLRPIEQGVDLVIHSATKYLGGHNDLVAGVLCGSKALVDEVFRFYGMIGPIPGALTCFLLERGLKTFPMRMKQHNANGLAVARALEGHPKIERVFYHGLESHPDHRIAKEQMRGFGSVISFLVKGGLEDAARFVDALKIFLITPSLGGTESLITQIAIMSYWEYSKEVRESLGIPDNLVRISLGCEDVEDLIADLKQALDKI